MGVFGNTFGINGGKSNLNNYLAEANAYFAMVAAANGVVVDKNLVNSEIQKAKDEGYFDKIGYWVDKSFGTFTGNESNSTNKKAIVTFNFDDGKATDYTQLFNTFYTQRGLLATSFINTKFIINGSPTGYLSSSQVATMAAAGWDFQCHTWSHARSNGSGMGGDVEPTMGLTGCTPSQIVEEHVNSNSNFTTLGLPAPKHMAYPNYVTNYTTVLPIVAQYRKSMRSGNTHPVTGRNYSKISWWSHVGQNFSTLAAMKVFVDTAVREKEPLMFSGHTEDQTILGSLLDYITGLGAEVVTMSQYYDRINAYRNYLFNLKTYSADYEALIQFDNGVPTAKQGIIVFMDTLANVGTSVADYFIGKGYHVSFWSDNSQNAMSYTIPNNTKFYNGTALTFDSGNARINLTGHYFINSGYVYPVYFTGTTLPSPLVANTKYYAGAAGANAFKVSATQGGTAVTLSGSMSADAKLYTYGYRDELWSYSSGSLACAKDFTNRSTDVLMSNKSISGDINDMGFRYFGHTGLSFANLNLSTNFITGSIPEDFRYLRINYFNFSYNRLTGGLTNLPRQSSRWYFNNNLISEAFPSNIGYWYWLDILQINNNSITGSFPTGEFGIGKCTLLTTLNVSYNQMSGIIPSELANLTLIQRLKLLNNSFTGYQAGAISTAMTAFIELDLSSNALTVDAVNQICIDVNALRVATGKSGVGFSLKLSGGTNAAPTGAGLTAYNAIAAAGWTVTKN